MTPENVAAFIAENLTQQHFAGYLTDPDRLLLARSTRTSRMIGYAMLIRGVPDDDDVARAVTMRPAVEISKMYVLPDDHGAGVSAALMTEALQQAPQLDAKSVWLGVNQNNHRAQRFYPSTASRSTAPRHFGSGTRIENDYVMVRPA